MMRPQALMAAASAKLSRFLQPIRENLPADRHGLSKRRNKFLS